MSESSDLHPLFVQLQSRYPTSGLLTELVQIHADRFVVRALVQLGSVTLATSLATAATVEGAEDQARLRVLALIGIHPATPSDLSATLPDLPLALAELPKTTFSSYGTQPPPLTKQPATDALQDAVPSTAFDRGGQAPLAPQSDVGITIAPPSPLPSPTRSVEPPSFTKAALPLIVYPSDVVLDPIDAPDYEDETFEPEAPEPETFEPQSFEFEPEPSEPEPFEPAPLESAPSSANEPAAQTTEQQTSKSKSRKPSAAKDAPALETSNSVSRDLSSLISQIGVEIDRIGWSKRQGSTYLQKTYGKKTRSELTDEELEAFLTYLNTQPSAGEGEE
jgi:hypothetical protein